MKTLFKLLSLGVIVSCLSAGASAAISPKSSLWGKFLVSGVKGDVTCITNGRVMEMKKGDTFLGRGTIVRTGAGSHVTIVFSNGTGVYTDEKTNFEIIKFDQEFFAPNNNLRVEPSNSSTLVKLNTGRVVLSTPRLVSGTTMVYETTHAAVGVRGEKILIEASEQQTHVAIISGLATVNVRDPDGNFVSIGKRLTTGKEAYVKRALGGSADEEVAKVEDTAADPTKHEKGGMPTPAGGTASASGLTFRTPPPPSITKDGEALVLRVAGIANIRTPGSSQDTPVSMGAKLTRGTTISTGAGSEVHLQTFPGAVATLRSNTTALIETLAITTAGAAVQKQTAMLSLKTGEIVSTIDPAKRNINDYSIRTPQGIASAKGTSFVVTVLGDGFSVAATADTVSFLIPDGTVYEVAAGMVSITPPGGTPQAPVSLASAVAANPALATVVQNAFTTVANLVQNNVGGLSPESATNLLAKVAHTAANALPSQAPAFAAQAVSAVNASASATATASSAAVAAMVHAVTSAAPTQAAEIASASTTAAPTQSVVIAAAAAKEAPSQATQIAVSVTRVVVQPESDGTVSQSTVQTVAAIAAAVSAAAPDQAPPIAAAVMQALTQAAPKWSPSANASSAAVIAAAATSAVPAQAAPIASAMMKTLMQSPAFNDAAPQTIAQSAATLASAITAVVPAQAQPVATAVMQTVVEANPNVTPGALAEIAGTLASAVVQIAPGQSAGVFEGVAGASNQTASAVEAAAAQFSTQGAAIAQQAAQINEAVAQAAQEGAEGTRAVGEGVLLAQDRAAAGAAFDVEGNNATSIIITEFNPTEINQLTLDLGAAESAQSEVQFRTVVDEFGRTTVTPFATSPARPPPEFLVSPSRDKDKDKDKDNG